MSVIIENVAMPRNCKECPFLYDGDACYALNRPDSVVLPLVCNSASTEYKLNEFPYWEKRVDWCPLKPERKTGRWTETCEFHGDTNVVSHKALACSVCNVAFIGGYGYGIKEMLEDFRYCPNCGAKMEEDHVQDTPQ